MRVYHIELQLKELAYNLPFPMRCGDMVAVATYTGCLPATIRLLQLFDPADAFENDADFIDRCEEVKLLMDEGRHVQKNCYEAFED